MGATQDKTIAVTGSTGLIGQRAVADLHAAGHRVVRVVRGDASGSDIAWDPEGHLDPASLRGVDAVVHLAGEPLAGGRWTDAQRERIMRSRRSGTRTVAAAIAEAVAAADGPQVLVCASGINLFDDHGDEVVTEDTPPGTDFLAEVVRAWEAAADPARQAGVRVAHLRFGQVLDPAGGSLARMVPLFKLGLGGRFGSGRQWWPWIAIDDVSAAIRWAIETPTAEGGYNTTSPNPVTNAEFTRALAGVLGRPAIIPIPAFGPRLLLGELADVLLMTSLRAVPARLQAEGFTFAHPDIEGALRHVLDR